MKNPLISVIIPVYNPGVHLYKCLDSVINQTYSNLQIILIDDGSTDGSSAVCDEYAQKDARIQCVHKTNGGVSKARNVGIELATGDYYHFPDSDDYYELDTYEYLLHQIETYNCDAVSFEYYCTYPDRETVHSLSDSHYGIFDTKTSIYKHMFGGNNFLCTKLLPAYAVKDLRFREDIFRDEDTLFATAALQRVSKVLFSSRPLLHYVQSEESACRGVFRPSQLSAVKAIPIWEEFFSKNYPEWLNKWRNGYMSLMIMLYGDMYLDEQDYTQEMKSIYKVFLTLYKKTGFFNIYSRKNKIKYLFFKISPRLFCIAHKLIHGL